MGDISDMMLDGTLDFYTGEYIGKGKGIPRTLDKSLPWEKNQLMNDNLDWRKVVDFLKSESISENFHPQIMREYGCTYKGKRPFKNACLEVLKDFEKFKNFIRERKRT